MKALSLVAAGLLLSQSAYSGIVPDDYKARIISEVAATRELANEGTYSIRFSQPAYAAVGDSRNKSSAQIEGAVRFILIWEPPAKPGVLNNIGFVPEVALFDGTGHVTLVGDVDWIWGLPKLDDAKVAVAFPPSSHQRK